jgi:2-dehydropantoate 2-reductase
VKVLVAGTGGVGGYYGARLLANGHDVWFLARGENLKALRTHGLTVLSSFGDLRFDEVQAVEDGADAGPVDAVLFCVKTYDNDSAAHAVAAAVQPGTAICSLQNGVENEWFLSGRFPRAPVIGGVARLESWLEAPGVIVQRGGLADLVIGAFRPEDGGAAESLARGFEGTSVPIRVTDDIDSALWFKLLVIAGIGGVTAYCRCPVGKLRSDDGLMSLLVRAMEEVERVAGARKVALPPDPVQTVLASVSSALDPQAKSSMCRDVEHGRPLEVEAINGAVVRFGAETGIDTPANRTILDRLLPLHRAAMAGRVESRPTG